MCKSIYGEFVKLKQQQLCSGVKTGGKGPCLGDSGGPLLWSMKTAPNKWYQIGIVSWCFEPCGNPHYPAVYTKVSSYIDWINSKIRKEQ